MPLLGLRNIAEEPIILDCSAQMCARPIHALVDALRNLGLTIHYLETDNQLPISINGKLLGGNVEVSGMTSQYISALLVALRNIMQERSDVRISIKIAEYLTTLSKVQEIATSLRSSQ